MRYLMFLIEFFHGEIDHAGTSHAHPDEVVCAKFQSVLETDCATLTTTCLMCDGDGSQSGESCGELLERFSTYRDEILATACDECYPERFNEIKTCCSRTGG